MPNKNISNLNLRTPNTGDFLAIWRTSTNTTDKIYINNLVALSPEAASTIPLTGCVSGASNVGPSTADGLIFLRNQSGILEFKKIAGGSNVTIGNETGRVVINAADPPAVPITSLANVGVGPGLIYSGLQSNQANIRSISGEGGIRVFTTHPSTITISGASGINVSSGNGTIFHSDIINNRYQFKTIETGLGIGVTNKTGTVQIINLNPFTGLPYSVAHGNGNSFRIPYGQYNSVPGDEPANQSPVFQTITFGAGSPTLSIPAGNGIYMIDFVYGYAGGSTANYFWIKFRDTTNNLDITNSLVLHYERVTPLNSYTSRMKRVIASLTGPITVVPQCLHSGYYFTAENEPVVISTGTVFSYVKIV